MTDNDNTPTFVEDIHWRGKIWRQEFYATDTYDLIVPPYGIHAVCFTKDKQALFFKHIDGYNSLPGGGMNAGETPTKALAREVMEEAAAKVMESDCIGYIKSWPIDDPGRMTYALRYWARVRVLDKKIKDPSKKSIGRVLASLENAAEVLGWGDRGKLLIDLAWQKYQKEVNPDVSVGVPTSHK